MNDMPKISIIMPVYNSALFIRQALDSVLKQTFGEFELICVNSASTDNSLEILQEYASKDARIKIIDKTRATQGFDRNYALDFTIGEYILYLDSDDWLKENALELMYNKAASDDVDILIFDAIKYYESNQKFLPYRYTEIFYDEFEDKVFNPLQAKDFIFSLNALPLKIYKKSFLVENDIKYSDHRFVEDSIFFVKAIVCAKRISCLRENIYYYRVREDSATFTAGENFANIPEVFKMCEKIIEDAHLQNEYMYSFINNRIRQMFFYYNKVKDKKGRKKAYKIMKDLLKYICGKYTLNIVPKKYLLNVKTILSSSCAMYDFIRKFRQTVVILRTYLFI